MALHKIVIYALVFSLSAPARGDTRSFALAVGESQIVRFPSGTDLAVSRRGVVDLFHQGDGIWELTALRAGFVVIDGRDAATGDARPPRIFVTVAPSGERPAFAELPDLPAWLCKPKGVRCDKGAGIVAGVSDDPLWLRRGAAYCDRGDACLFAVHLSADGQRTNPTRYRLAAKIFLMEDGAAEELGFSPEAAVAFTAPPGKADVSLLARLRALARDHKAEILGEPLFRLTPGQEAALVNGGEFQVLERGKDGDAPVTAWKQHGLALKLTLSPLSDGRARLAYDLSLKAPADGRSALTVNSLKSEVELPVGTPVLVGILDLEAKRQDAQTAPPFSSIPLIGPLFRGSGGQASKSRLGLWLHLEGDRDEALTGPWTKALPP